MRVAFIGPTVPRREELTFGPIDAEWLLGLQARGEDLVVLVDEEGQGIERLRDAGVSVHVSPKRPIELAEKGRVSADAAQAHLLATLHGETPFDCIVASSDHSSDPAWLEPGLAAVPLIVAPDGGLRDLNLILDDPYLFRTHGRQLWAVAGFVARADAVLADVPTRRLGLDLPDEEPARLSPAGAHASLRPPSGPPALAVVVALSEDRIGLGSLITSTAERVDIGEETSIVVVAPRLTVGAESTHDVIVAGCPEHLLTRTVIVAPDGDGSAAAFLATADLIVAARPSDLTVNAVREAIADTAAILLNGEPPQPGLPFAAPPPAPAGHGERMLLPIDGRPAAMSGSLRHVANADFVILHTPRGTQDAFRLLNTPRVEATDLLMLGTPHPVTGAPSALRLSPDVLGVHRSVLSSLERRLASAGSLWELIVWCSGMSLTDRVRLSVLPAPLSAPTRDIPVDDVAGLPAWLHGRGVLARPNTSELRRHSESTGGPTDGPSVREWAKSHRWTDRVRLALPWKWGLLRRAMRGRW